MLLNRQTPTREAMILKAMAVAKRAKENQTPLVLDVEIKRILATYPDSPLSADELAAEIGKFCGWLGVPAQLEAASRRVA